jgi:hypothetical protein
MTIAQDLIDIFTAFLPDNYSLIFRDLGKPEDSYWAINVNCPVKSQKNATMVAGTVRVIGGRINVSLHQKAGSKSQKVFRTYEIFAEKYPDFSGICKFT